jgi:hypothetical protein
MTGAPPPTAGPLKVLVAGIDPGQKGGIAVFDKISERLQFCIPMPVVEKTVGKSIRLRTDYTGIVDVVRFFVELGVRLVVIEDVGAGFGASGRQLGENVGAIRMSVHASSLRYEFISPGVWKKAMAAPAKKSESFARAEQLFPEDRGMLKGPRKGKHDGMAEAAMIAAYGSRKLVD